MTYSSSLTIEELDADRSVLRALTLVGPALPKVGAPWGTESSVPTTWYPGNPDEATQHVLVTKLVPSEWEGEWNLTRIDRQPSRYVESQQGGAALAVTTPGYLIDTIEDLQLKGRRLRVTWATDSDDNQIARTVVREGRIKSFEARYRTSVDVEWKATFAWVSRGGSQQRVVATRDSQTSGATAALQSAMAATQAAVTALIAAENNPTSFSLGQLEDLADAPLALVGALSNTIEEDLFTLQQVAGIVTQFRNLPYNVAAQTLGTATDVLAGCRLFADSFSRTPPEQTVLSDQVDALVSAYVQLATVYDATDEAARQAQSVQAQMRVTLAAATSQQGAQNPQTTSGSRPQNILAIRISRDGDTPQGLSNLYYGTPDHDLDIMRANDLPWYQATIATGTMLVIPVLTTQQSP